LTSGVGSKWKSFFQDLETSYHLDPDNPAHIWLLHHLFLLTINQELTEWANTWNHHHIAIPGVGHRLPHELRWFSMLESGACGFENPQDNLDPQQIDEYGIDWEDYDDPVIRNHHNGTHTPVQVDEPGCPLTLEQVQLLDNYIATFPDDGTMGSRCVQWSQALEFCTRLS
jgi:hypothetical protein